MNAPKYYPGQLICTSDSVFRVTHIVWNGEEFLYYNFVKKTWIPESKIVDSWEP